MMREITFRGKTVDRRKWIYGSLIVLDDDFNYIMPRCEFASTLTKWELIRLESEPVLQSTIGQYTGVTDKNGVRVFEGDIIRTQLTRLVRIEYSVVGGFAGFDMTPSESPHECSWASTAWRSGNIEVVGNIHDNPEMMRG